jgi:hypothetical protein
MKTTLIVKRLVQAAVLGAALVSAAAIAQPGPGAGWGGWGGGWCGGPGMQRGMGPGGGWGMGPGGGRGMGYGRGYGMGPGAYANQGVPAGQNAVRGWELMSPVERSEQQAKIFAAKTYDECTAIQTEHRGKLELRAKEKGLTLLAPPFNPCDNLKARGFIQ